VLATLMSEGRVAFWELLLIGARDVLELGGCVFVVARRGRSALTQLPPTRLGKLATTGQLAFLLLIVLGWGPGLTHQPGTSGYSRKSGSLLLYSPAGWESDAFCTIDRQDNPTSSATSAP
jgi:phosphatidylglycerophosphate synthase